ncbi:MAG: hypothetical protein IJV69_02905 [Kiritimatiellae bacterium]|nr:hypothetical protein [Kiritimatiellia bacterium]
MWQILTSETLLSRLSGPEHQALDRAAVDWQQDEVLGTIAHEVAEDWRGGLRRVTTVDARIDAVPSEILLHILADYRYRAFTRLPGMRGLLDELRIEEWKRALQVRDALAKVSFERPSAENLPPEEAITLPLPEIHVTHRHRLD